MAGWSSLSRSFSVELAPTFLLKHSAAAARLLPTLPVGTRIYLPSLPADPPDAIERAIATLRRAHAGLVPVPHIPAQRVASLAMLERQLVAWQREAGALREVLVVRGDAHGHSTAHAPAGASAEGTAPARFVDSLALLETNVLQRHGIDAVSLCGHPEGVGHLSAAQAREALERKLQWAAAAGMAPRVVTQFCFDAGATTRFVDELRRGAGAASGTPISLGVVGPSDLALRTRMARRCGVAPPPAEGADAGTPAASEEHGQAWPAAYVESLGRWHAARGAAAEGVSLHLYPFGGLDKTLAWVATRD